MEYIILLCRLQAGSCVRWASLLYLVRSFLFWRCVVIWHPFCVPLCSSQAAQSCLWLIDRILGVPEQDRLLFSVRLRDEVFVVKFLSLFEEWGLSWEYLFEVAA